MNLFQNFIHTFSHYTMELWWSLGLGFLLSGLCYEFIPAKIVERHLGEKGLRPILLTAVVGAFLPICCIGSLPIALTLRKKGASLGPVLTFLITTPATSLPALIVCWRLLGLGFTVMIFFSAVVMGIVMGLIGNRIPAIQDASSVTENTCCSSAEQSETHKISLGVKLRSAFKYAFVTLPKEIGLQIILGMAVASFIVVFEPIQHFIKQYMAGWKGYGIIILVGLLDYVCSTASVPMADALVRSGMSPGQALVYLLVGPVTSYSTILVIKKDFGNKVLTWYLTTICIVSLVCGIIFDLFTHQFNLR